jgi:hypothetical protein
MSPIQHRTTWFSRIVLAAATLLLLLRISLEDVVDPIGSVAPHAIALGSAEAITIMRVSGGVFLGIALALVACLASERRILVGLGLLATIATTILLVRLAGLAVDGPAPFTTKVLKPGVALVLFSGIALLFERRRREEPLGVRERAFDGAASPARPEHAS